MGPGAVQSYYFMWGRPILADRLQDWVVASGQGLRYIWRCVNGASRYTKSGVVKPYSYCKMLDEGCVLALRLGT